MSDLESRYRHALRWYPKKWRTANEDAILGTLLDRADDEKRQVPAAGELANLRGSAILTRLGPLGRISAPIRDRAAALALGLGAAIGGAGLLALLWDTHSIPVAARDQVHTFGPFASVGAILYGLWILAFVVALAGLRRPTTAILVVTLPSSAATYFLDRDFPSWWPTTLTTMALLAALALVSLAGRPTRTPSGVRRTLISAAGWAAAIAGTLWVHEATQGGAAGRTDWFLGPLWQWLYFAIPFALVLAMVLCGLRQSSWSGALLIVLIPLLLFVIFGWSTQDLVVRGTGLAAILAGIALGYFVPRIFGPRIRHTRV